MVHESVLQKEAIQALVTVSSGRYVDATFGRGGHTLALLSVLDHEAGVLAIDRDPDAIRAARDLAERDPRVLVVKRSFGALSEALSEVSWGRVHGVFLDLGVSSPQLDEAQRGFSFRRDGPLDMRMDPESGESAADWLARADEDAIRRVLKDYGEERFARRIARSIVSIRGQAPLTRTTQLAELIDEAVPFRDRHKHPATRSFQAIRIHINSELEELDSVLEQAADALEPGGRLVVISFHSLEDRRVKRFMRECSRGPSIPKGVPVTADAEQPSFRVVGKAVRADSAERESNLRARSAVMRVLECLH